MLSQHLPRNQRMRALKEFQWVCGERQRARGVSGWGGWGVAIRPARGLPQVGDAAKGGQGGDVGRVVVSDLRDLWPLRLQLLEVLDVRTDDGNVRCTSKKPSVMQVLQCGAVWRLPTMIASRVLASRGLAN